MLTTDGLPELVIEGDASQVPGIVSEAAAEAVQAERARVLALIEEARDGAPREAQAVLAWLREQVEGRP